ncbi:MAG: AsmA family protein [Alphaproteobacteria bacterium]|nr:AsmA family protein [Alphaproteobacteria bacterium]
MIKKLLIGLGVVIVLLIAAAVIVPTFIPVETYKTQIAQQVRKNTGRDFAISGDVSFSIFPTLGFEANGITFGNGPGYTDANMAALSKVVVAVKFAPLLSGAIEVDRFVLVDPVISLEVSKDGKPNWDLAAGKAVADTPAGAPAESPSTAQADGGGIDLAALKLGEVRLENGTVSYRDQSSGQVINLSKISMDLGLPGLDAPMKAKGQATWNGEEVGIRLDVNTPADLLNGRKTPVVLNVESRPVKLAFNGQLTNAEVLTGGGSIDLDVPSVRALAAWAGAPLQAGEQGFGPLQLKGTLGLNGSRYSFADAQIAFDEIRGTGGLTFDGSGKVPYVQAALTVERLDLNPYLPGQPGLTAAPKQEGGSAGQTGGGKPADGWSDEPIDATGLRAINADLDFRSGEIVIRNIKIDRGAVKIALKGGRANITLSDLALYGGQGQGALTLDASGKVLGVQQQFQVTGIQAKPLLSAAVGSEMLEGGGAMAVDVTSRGASQRQLISNLNGNGSFKFVDGAINGINIAEIVRRIGSLDVKAVFDPRAMNVPQKTDFAELSGTFVVRKGVAQNSDLLMLSPLLRMTGKGSANMPQRTVNYRVEPKVVATLEGQGGKKDLKGLVVPFSITGSWDKPQVTPDLAAMMGSDPKGTVEGLIKSLTGKEKGASAPATGSGAGQAAPSGQGQPATQNPADILNKQLKKLLGN